MSRSRRIYSDSVRRPDWDYRWSAWYFVTICTDRRIPYFGEVRDGIVGLTVSGCVVANYWQQIPELNENAVLDEFMVMSNHVHGLLGLQPGSNGGIPPADVDRTGNANEASLDSNDASKISDSSENVDKQMSQISPNAGSVSVIIRSFKSAVTKRVRRTLRTDFGWQPRFDDHIVRNERAFQNIRRYIMTNPERWERDRLHPEWS